MNARTIAQPQKTASTTQTPAPASLLQRKCACGGAAGLTDECQGCRGGKLGLQRASLSPMGRGVEGEGYVPPVVYEVLRSPGQPLDPQTRAFMEPRFGHDFSQVRVHSGTQAAESARSVNALAYTVGRDVVFGAGQYAPGTSGGNKLLAHELTHTLQQRGWGLSAGSRLEITTATDPTEKEAEATATAALQGKPDIPTLHAPLRIARQPAGPTPARPAPTVTAPANDPFANEDPALRRRRLAVISASQNVIDRVRNALSRGYAWDFEDVTAGVVTGKFTGETLANREARLRQLMADLALMSSELLSAPIPYMWTAPEVKIQSAEGPEEMEAVSTDPSKDALKDTKMFYAHRGNALGQYRWLMFVNWSYIDAAPVPTPAVRRAPTDRGSGTGIYIHVPDPKNAPLVYRRLTGHQGWQQRGLIIEVWSDDIGYYYHGKDGKIYLPGKP